DSRPDRPARHSPCRRVLASRRSVRRWTCAFLVCAFAFVDLGRFAHAHGDLLGRTDCLCAAGPEPVAARHAGNLFRLLSVVCSRGAGFLWIPVRWHAAGGWFHLSLLRAAGISARAWRRTSAFACQPVLAAVGVAAHLF